MSTPPEDETPPNYRQSNPRCGNCKHYKIEHTKTAEEAHRTYPSMLQTCKKFGCTTTKNRLCDEHE